MTAADLRGPGRLCCDACGAIGEYGDLATGLRIEHADGCSALAEGRIATIVLAPVCTGGSEPIDRLVFSAPPPEGLWLEWTLSGRVEP